MFEVKYGRTDSHAVMTAGRVGDSHEGPGSAGSGQVIGLDPNRGRVPGAIVETAMPDMRITACLFCRYRKPARQTGEGGDA